MKDVTENFPQLEDKVECVQLCGPFRSGLVQNPIRFAIRGNRPESPYPGLYVGGSDLTIADSFSGSVVGSWLAANAVMGYSMIDYTYLKKNITSDLGQFLEEPSVVYDNEEEDLAVPFENNNVVSKGKKDEDNVNPTSAAESSKEE